MITLVCVLTCCICYCSTSKDDVDVFWDEDFGHVQYNAGGGAHLQIRARIVTNSECASDIQLFCWVHVFSKVACNNAVLNEYVK